QRFNPRIRARSAKSHCCSEGESGENNWLTKLPLQPIERGADVVQFASPVIVLPFAQARASKIKPQHGKAKAVEGFHGVEHDLVVQCASVHRMRIPLRKPSRRGRRLAVMATMARGLPPGRALLLSHRYSSSVYSLLRRCNSELRPRVTRCQTHHCGTSGGGSAFAQPCHPDRFAVC